MGRAPRTKETLPDFREWCRATRHPLLFRGLTGCQRTPGNGVSQKESIIGLFYDSILILSILVVYQLTMK